MIKDNNLASLNYLSLKDFLIAELNEITSIVMRIKDEILSDFHNTVYFKDLLLNQNIELVMDSLTYSLQSRETRSLFDGYCMIQTWYIYLMNTSNMSLTIDESEISRSTRIFNSNILDQSFTSPEEFKDRILKIIDGLFTKMQFWMRLVIITESFLLISFMIFFAVIVYKLLRRYTIGYNSLQHLKSPELKDRLIQLRSSLLVIHEFEHSAYYDNSFMKPPESYIHDKIGKFAQNNLLTKRRNKWHKQVKYYSYGMFKPFCGLSLFFFVLTLFVLVSFIYIGQFLENTIGIIYIARDIDYVANIQILHYSSIMSAMNMDVNRKLFGGGFWDGLSILEKKAEDSTISYISHSQNKLSRALYSNSLDFTSLFTDSACLRLAKYNKNISLCTSLDSSIPNAGLTQILYRNNKLLGDLLVETKTSKENIKQQLNSNDFIDWEFTFLTIYLPLYAATTIDIKDRITEYLLTTSIIFTWIGVVGGGVFIGVLVLIYMIKISFARINKGILFAFQMLPIISLIDNMEVKVAYMKLFIANKNNV